MDAQRWWCWWGILGGVWGQVQELHSRALTSKFQELQEASGAGESERPGQRPSRGQTLMGGQRVQADHAVLFRPLYIDLGFYSE